MGTKDISALSLVLAFATVLAILVVFRITRVRLHKHLLIAVARMSVQLGLVGLYLTVLFELNNPAVNFGYILLMIGVANYSVLRNSGLRPALFFFTFPALLIAMLSVLGYFIIFVYAPEPLFDARYVIPVGGMLLGNSMNRTIISLERFYSSVRNDSDGYASLVSMGATVREATRPYLTTAYRAGMAPWLASISTMGIVSLPGMMTGQILGGSPPIVAIKYQITIILAILIATELASLLTILFSMRRCFNTFGFLREDIFKPI
ncbi:MAG: ABC transporter permease [Deltaproteobacteria bacterium]|nr:ABC transporter permease [Deltaproteobacteria bacterium]